MIGLVFLTAAVAGTPARSLRGTHIPVPDQSAFAASGREIAAQIEDLRKGDDGVPVPSIVYVFAEPGLLFQLCEARMVNVVPAGSMQFAQSQFSQPGLKVYLAVGIHAQGDLQFRAQFTALGNRLKKIGSWPWHVGPLTALDQPDCQPSKLGHQPTEVSSIDVYEVLPP